MPLPRQSIPGHPCNHCGEPIVHTYSHGSLGLCAACYFYRYKLGKDRPLSTIEAARRRNAGLKRCPTCRVTKARSEYYGKQSTECQSCSRARSRRYNRAHRSIPRQVICEFCGKSFGTYRANARRCSSQCAQKAWKVANRAKLRIETDWWYIRKKNAYVADVSRIAIYERDGWTCQLCHKPVNRELPPRHAYSASIDHIVPLSQGGTHEPANVQLAHLRCNSAKGARMQNGSILMAQGITDATA